MLTAVTEPTRRDNVSPRMLILIGVLLIVVGIVIWAVLGVPGVLGVIALAVGVIAVIVGSARAARAANERDAAVSSAARQMVSGSTVPDLATQLAKLSALRDSGAISESDYEKAKRQLLDRP